MTPTPLDQLEPRARRALLARSVLRILLTTVVLLVVYVVVPFDNLHRAGTLIYFVAGGAAFVAVVVWQLRCVVEADYPHLRAVEAVGASVPLMVIVFATVYLSMSQINHAAFSERLDHPGSLYFTITVLSTVGFGDIVPRTGVARIVVALQMLLDLALIGTTVRLLVNAARLGVARRDSGPDDA